MRHEATTAAGGQLGARLVWVAGLMLALGIAGGAGIATPAGAAAFSGPCGAYETQEAAQADYDAGLLDPALVDFDGNGIACEGLPSGGTGPVDVGTCGAFSTQEEAQAAFDRGELDPTLADYDGNGVACEGLPVAGSTVGEPVELEEVAGVAEVVPAQPSLVGDAPAVTALPSTGIGQVVPVDGANQEVAGLLLLAAVIAASTVAGAVVLLWGRRTAV